MCIYLKEQNRPAEMVQIVCGTLFTIEVGWRYEVLQTSWSYEVESQALFLKFSLAKNLQNGYKGWI